MYFISMIAIVSAYVGYGYGIENGIIAAVVLVCVYGADVIGESKGN